MASVAAFGTLVDAARVVCNGQIEAARSKFLCALAEGGSDQDATDALVLACEAATTSLCEAVDRAVASAKPGVSSTVSGSNSSHAKPGSGSSEVVNTLEQLCDSDAALNVYSGVRPDWSTLASCGGAICSKPPQKRKTNADQGEVQALGGGGDRTDRKRSRSKTPALSELC
jgi:hypothetical protein